LQTDRSKTGCECHITLALNYNRPKTQW